MRAAILFLALAAGGTLTAQNLTLTAAGVSNGFTLTKFATINPGQNLNTGVFGVVVLSNGNVMVNNYSSDTRYVFADTDGQTPSTALKAVPSSGSQAGAFARAGGQAYGPVNVKFVQFNPDGTVNHILTGVSQTPWFGMWGNPVNGHVLSTTGQGQIIDIDPNANGGTGSATVITSPGLGYDGVAVSPDGAIVYVVQTDHIVGYNIASHAQVFDSGLLTGGPDGIGVIISNNSLNGKLLINFNGLTLNGGFVGILDPATKVLTTIATSGTRGDYVSPDTNNGSAFLSYSDVVYRISCGTGCAIGQAVAPVTPPPGGATEGIRTVAGNGIAALTGDGGPATSASLNNPYGVAVDGAGNIYIADYGNSRIRVVDTAGNIRTVAGCGPISNTACILAGIGDGGPATAPLIFNPWDIVVDGQGNFYFTDSGHNSVRKVDSAGIITTFAGGRKGFAGDGGQAASASVDNPIGLALDNAGNLYFADQNNNRVRRVSTAGVITTVAGNGAARFSGDGGPATSAGLNSPHGVSVDSAGNIYIADTSNFRIRKVNTAGIISTVAGNGSVLFAGDGGPATSAALASPWDVKVDGAGNLYISDWLNNRIRKVDTNGIITTIAGSATSGFSGDGGAATSAQLFGPTGIALDALGNVYVADSNNHRIRKISAPPPPPPTIAANGVVNGASFLSGIVPNSWATIGGSNLAPLTDYWNNFIVNGKLPTTLDGVTVTVGGKLAYLYFISPGQINFVAPDVPPGPVQVTVTTAGGASAAFTVTSSQYGPAFFPWPGNQAVATRQDFTYAVKNGTFPGATTVPAKPGDVIILWGTGFGPTNPAAPSGFLVPSDRTYSTSTLPTVTINNVPATVFGAALAPGYAGLYQVAIQVPSSLPDGDWPVVASIGGVSSPSGLLLSVHQ